jgi:N-acetylglucosamine-6-phosphate deacetylase
LHHACECLREDGCSQILATYITDTIENLETRMRTLVELRERDPLAQEIIAGIHIEGPFINVEKGYVGAHPPPCVKPATVDDAKRLLDAAQGHAKLVTLAPECDAGFKTSAYLSSQGVVVSAGHCNPDLDTLRASTENGVTMFTHVGNGCPMLMHRHNNIIQRALSLRRHLRYTMIADGHHLPYWLVADWVDRLGADRVAIISDAISAACLPAGIYRLGERSVRVGDDGVPRSEDGSHFVGSGMTLGMMDRGLAQYCPWPAETRTKLFRDNAAAWLGIDLHAIH